MIAIAITFFFFRSGINEIEEDVFLAKEKESELFAKEKLEAKMQVAVLSAINLAQNRFIVDALLTNNKSAVKQELLKLTDSFKESSAYKNMKIHIHTSDVKSFLRHWNDKSGDDLSSFRKTILQVKNTKKPLFGIEVGKAGLELRGVAPIINDGIYIGSVEIMQSFESIVKDFKKDLDASVIISMSGKLLDIATSLKDAPKIVSGGYVVIQKPENLDKKLLDELKDVKSDNIVKSFFTDNYFVSKIPIFDFENKEIGYIFIANTKESMTKTVKAAENSMINQMIVTFIAVVLVIVSLIAIMQIYVVNPINNLKKYANELAIGDGDLTRKIPVDSKDEIGKTAEEFNGFVEKVRKTVAIAKDVSAENASISNQLSSTSSVVGKSVEETAMAIENTFEMSNKLKEGIKGAAQSVLKTSELLKNTATRLNEAKSDIVNIVRSIDETSRNEGELADYMKTLNSNTTQVKSVLNVISDIADQINLLALNAAIEAARAGEHGRGFAVVADEVRKLAERTQTSLTEINVTINSIVSSVGEATTKMETNVKKTKDLMCVAEKTRQTVESANEAMIESEIQSENSANDFSKKGEDINDVLSRIEKINQISSVNMRNTEEIATSAEHLHSIGEKLNQVLITFRT